MDVIESLDDETKQVFYEGKYKYQTSNTTYGILAENYSIEYALSESGDVEIDANNLNKLKILLEDEDTIEKILVNKTNSIGLNGISDTALTNIVDKQKNEISVLKDAIESGEESIELTALSNWTGKMIVSHVSYTGGVSTKNVTYTWKWEYNPLWVLTDKVAMAWSGGYTAVPSSIRWTYKRRVGYRGTSSSVYTDSDSSGYGYDDYNPGAGVAKGIDIKDPLAGTYIIFHSGTLSATIKKTTNVNDYESAVGRYYHKHIVASLSLSFSKTGPSISVSDVSGTYDQSVDSADDFWTMTDD